MARTGRKQKRSPVARKLQPGPKATAVVLKPRLKKVSWKRLKVGDRVRVVDWPAELKPHLCHVDTFKIYKYIINAESALVVDSIDHLGIPYGKLIREGKKGRWLDWIGLNHSQLELILD